jgi:hypothetical protein
MLSFFIITVKNINEGLSRDARVHETIVESCHKVIELDFKGVSLHEKCIGGYDVTVD